MRILHSCVRIRVCIDVVFFFPPPSSAHLSMDCPSSHSKKRPVFFDLTNETDSPSPKKALCSPSCEHAKLCGCASQFMPTVPDAPEFDNDDDSGPQSIHPDLPDYFPIVGGSKMSHDDLSALLSNEDDTVLLDFLAKHGVISSSQECENCGALMRRWKDNSSGQWHWICTKSKNGIKCKNLKFSVKSGSFVRDAKLSTESILWIAWHFVYGLTEVQCKRYTNIGQANNKTVVNWYRLCREVCDGWIRKNFEPLGGFGKIVEIDESFLPGAPKYGRGRGQGDAWYDEDHWVFGLIERGRLDPWLQRVRTRGRKTLVAIINERCKDGTVFTSDKWRAYVDLQEHLQLEDCRHFTVNHKKNFVDPTTGAHTQTVEGNWNLLKKFFPDFGMRVDDVDSYIGTYMWLRYVKRRNLDAFLFFLKCAGEMNPPRRSLFSGRR